MFWDAPTERYKILFRDGKDAWVTGEAIDEAIAFHSTYSDLDKAEAAKEKWSKAVTATLLQYGMYCAKHVGPQSFPNNQAGTAMLNGVELQPQRFPEATDAPKEAMNRDSTETGELNPKVAEAKDITSEPRQVNAGVEVIADQTINPKVAEAKDITSEPNEVDAKQPNSAHMDVASQPESALERSRTRPYVPLEYRRPEYILNDIYSDMIDRRDVYLTNNGYGTARLGRRHLIGILDSWENVRSN
jgi:hypothetical protein